MEENKPKILIVDDEKTTREMYAEVFQSNGFAVEEAADGIEGLDKTSKIKFDVIFTGIMMPRMDGFSFMEQLKKNVTTSAVPVFVSSHLGKEDDRQRANQLGAKGFFVRSFSSPADIVKDIKEFLVQAQDYRLEVDPNLADVKKIAQDLGINPELKCGRCEGRMVLSLKIQNDANHLEKTLAGKFICPRCR